MIYLVFLPTPMELMRVTEDEIVAQRMARNIKGVYIEVPIKGDYRES